ncbi:hypothetical protein D910_10633 [Dendroctonus ponderosae]|uniref:ABC transmembrane type-1 domain-containing protein n=1 Tax=Dendroctonus ponderosae TaxID=77166 RepID=U4UTA4_DENPD|nr:hypothetical protein D910_10633 [Dendroctonus ponderosae]
MEIKKNHSSDQQEPPERQPDVPYHQLFQFATLLDKLLIAVGIIASIICGVFQPYLMVLFGDVSGVLLDFTTAMNANLTFEEEKLTTEKLYDGTEYFAIMTSVSALIILVCTYISVVFFTQSSLRQTCKMRKLFMEKTINQDIGWYDQNQTGDFASIITE